MPVLECAQTAPVEIKSESSIHEPSRSSWFPLWPGAEDNATTGTTGSGPIIELEYAGTEIGELKSDGTNTQADFYYSSASTNYIKFTFKQPSTSYIAQPSTGYISYKKSIGLDPYTTTTVGRQKYWKILYSQGDWLGLNGSDSSLVSWDCGPDDLNPGPIDMSAVPTPPQILIHKDNPKAREATERARVLLRSLLTPEQWREYEEHGTITISSQSGVRYRLDKRSRVRNITRLSEDDCGVELLCCHPLDDLPIEDVLIAQKLHLECAEDSFRKTANITPLAPVPSVRSRQMR